MTSRASSRQPSSLTIHPPSPSLYPPRITTPTHQIIPQIIPQIISPRKAPLPPSPTHSDYSNVSGLSARDGGLRSRKGSFDTQSHIGAPPVPRKDEKRLPVLPFPGIQLPRSPRKRGGGEDSLYGAGAGMYDNKLVRNLFAMGDAFEGGADQVGN